MKCPKCNEYAPDNNYKCPHCGEVLKPQITPADFHIKPVKRSRINPNVVILLLMVVGVAVLIYAAFFKGKGQTENNVKPAISTTTSTSTGTGTETGTGSDTDTGAEPGTGTGTEPGTGTDTDTDTGTGTDAGTDTDTGAGTSTGTGNGTLDVGYVINNQNPGEEIDIRIFVQADKTTIFDFYSEYCPPCRRISPLLKGLDTRREDIIVHKVDINRPGIQGIDWGSPVARQYNIHSVPFFMIYDPSGNLTHQGDAAYNEVMRLLQGK
jgi:thiol-disulfide isomerase/thioredoxin